MFKTMPIIVFLWFVLSSYALAIDDELGRFALVIGNQHYPQAPLTNSINDARAVSASLVALGFEVHTVIDSKSVDLKQEIQGFYANIKARDSAPSLAIFYYAGHAIQVEHHNYLVPLDVKFGNIENFMSKLFDLKQLFSEMSQVSGIQNIIILDACRNNPFSSENTGKDNFSSAGLAPLKAPTGTLIAYATEPGGVASDGRAKNGVYTKHLLRHIDKNVNVEELFKKVRNGVAKETRNKQIPWEHSSLLKEVFINPPRNKNVPDLIAF